MDWNGEDICWSFPPFHKVQIRKGIYEQGRSYTKKKKAKQLAIQLDASRFTKPLNVGEPP